MRFDYGDLRVSAHVPRSGLIPTGESLVSREEIASLPFEDKFGRGEEIVRGSI